MKSIITLLLVLLFASCGKQEVYEFEISAEQIKTKDYDINSTKFREWEKQNPDIPDFLIPWERFAKKTSKYKLTNKTLIKFFPVDEDGICFYQIESEYAEKKLSGEDANIRREKITSIDFYDKHSNKLFSFPFDDENATKAFDYYEGKTSKVSRSLLERVEQESIRLKFDFWILP